MISTWVPDPVEKLSTVMECCDLNRGPLKGVYKRFRFPLGVDIRQV